MRGRARTTKLRALARITIMMAIVTVGAAAVSSEADARCQRCIHDCCREVRGDGYHECFMGIDGATKRCLWCMAWTECRFTPSATGPGCGADDGATSENLEAWPECSAGGSEESSIYDQAA